MNTLKDFFDFIREQGVVGFAVGFILGGSISKVVTSFVNDIINPLIIAILGPAAELKKWIITLGSGKIAIGMFLSNTIDFLIIAFVVYTMVKIIHADRFDKKKQPAVVE
jgi:large conductance mechanosensitive channel